MIELAGADTADELAEIHAKAFDAPWSAEELRKLFENPAVFALMSRARRGFAMAWAAAGDAELITVAVVPEARRQGVGAELVSAAGILAKTRGAASMHLEVAEDNASARALYAKLGYDEVGRRASYYVRGAGSADAIVMRRALGA
jgi:ribosomal-protein-alanine N-acetyltransferase